ncbi:hypothetical protein QBC38DRAFT_461899 [Podospora fimiseda]|uniref:Uncharacterized protein n=1 Tax=Podospora fimiseda TaxID=252190 RepID=A0AAN6YN40_9PEZI|nr:hypothetical protein QBC38DRAFT_461899 [Podospora fimiseda]
MDSNGVNAPTLQTTRKSTQSREVLAVHSKSIASPTRTKRPIHRAELCRLAKKLWKLRTAFANQVQMSTLPNSVIAKFKRCIMDLDLCLRRWGL